MRRHLVTLEEFLAFPEWFREGIRKGIEGGFDVWQQILRAAASISSEPLQYDNTTHCNAIQDHIHGRLKTIFQEHGDEVRVDKFENDVLGVLYKNRVFVRFNKLTEDFRTRTRLTPSHQRYLNQDPDIPGLPRAVTILFAGYLPDKTMSLVKSINVVCWGADGLEWMFDYNSNSGEQQTGLGLVLPLTPTPNQPTETETRRVTGKKRKERTKDSQA